MGTMHDYECSECGGEVKIVSNWISLKEGGKLHVSDDICGKCGYIDFSVNTVFDDKGKVIQVWYEYEEFEQG